MRKIESSLHITQFFDFIMKMGSPNYLKNEILYRLFIDFEKDSYKGTLKCEIFWCKVQKHCPNIVAEPLRIGSLRPKTKFVHFGCVESETGKDDRTARLLAGILAMKPL